MQQYRASPYNEEERQTSHACTGFWGRVIRGSSYIIGYTEPLIKLENIESAVDSQEDGHQPLSGTCNGSVAAVAAYEWLDCAVGADNSGTGHRPAMASGIWQFRPSLDLVYPKGLYINHGEANTPSVFSRKLNTLKRVMELWLPEHASTPLPKATPSQPYRIIYLTDYLPDEDTEQMCHIDSFIHDLEVHLHASIQKLSIRETWNKHIHKVRDSNNRYRENFKERNGASPKPRRRPPLRQKLFCYRTWLLNNLFDDKNVEMLVALPIANSRSNSHHESLNSAENQTALDQRLISTLLGGPEIVVPIGDAPYHSTATTNTEYAPVAVKILAAPGQDFELLHAIETVMTNSLRPVVVSTR